MLKTLTATAALTLCATLAQAHDYTVGDLSIAHPFAYETAPTAMAGGGYLTITNAGDTPDRLIAVNADYPRVEVHQSLMKDGIAVMEAVPALEIAPGETVTLEPGGYHVMFMGLDGRAFADGDRIPATLVFEEAGEVAVEFAVEARPADGEAMDHGAMDHGAMDHGAMDHGAEAADPHAGH